MAAAIILKAFILIIHSMLLITKVYLVMYMAMQMVALKFKILLLLSHILKAKISLARWQDI